MSPSQFHDYHHLRRELNGPRPTPLKINKDSHSIHKPSPSTSSSTSASSPSIAAAAAKQSQHQQQRHPVIIYTHSPKIIHTQARDFMALVQKLTGLSRSDDPAPPQPQPSEAGVITRHGDSTSSLVAADENCIAPPVFDPPNPFLSDVPLFTPTPTNLFDSSGPLYRYPDSVFSPPTAGKSISPAVMEAMKALLEY